MTLLLGSSLIFLTMIPVAAIRFLRDRRRSSDRKPASRGSRAAYWIILGISVLDLAVAGYTAWYQYPVILFGHSPMYKLVLVLGVLSAVLTAGALVYMVLAWKNRYWSIADRTYYTLVTVAALAFVWFLNYWNLLGWRF